jgi:hypothetical protein
MAGKRRVHRFFRNLRIGFGGVVTGRYMPSWLGRVMSWYMMAWLIAVLAFVIGVAISLGSDRIQASTHVFSGWLFDHQGTGGIDGRVLLFWLALFLWSILLAFRLLAEDLRKDEQYEYSLQMFSNAPPLEFVTEYPKRFAKIMERLQRGMSEDSADRAASLAASIRDVLTEVARMASEFGGKRLLISYGANVMLLADRPFPDELIGALVFFDKKRFKNAAALATALNAHLRYLLYLPSELLVSSVEGAIERAIPLIALPVPDVETDAKAEEYAIPGAPFALVTGQSSVYDDTHTRARDDCLRFEAVVREEIEEYFTSKDGAGRDVRSFASWRIGTRDDPVGVLNIDCNDMYVLGKDARFHQQFHAFIVPILQLLRSPVLTYASFRQRSEIPLQEPCRRGVISSNDA